MARVLVIGGEPDLRESLECSLILAGHRALTASTGEAGLKTAREILPEVIILDLLLPDMHGVRVAEALRRNPETRPIPIIVVTARPEEIDGAAGFEIGEDDFVIKPFDVREILLRIEAVLRRSSRPPGQQIFVIGELRVDCEAHRVSVNAADVNLAALEFKLLVTL